MEILTKEESERKVDAEISIGEIEQRMEEEMQMKAIEARALAEEKLKHR